MALSDELDAAFASGADIDSLPIPPEKRNQSTQYWSTLQTMKERLPDIVSKALDRGETMEGLGKIVPPALLGAAQDTWQSLSVQRSTTKPGLGDTSIQGAKARTHQKRSSKEALDFDFIKNQLPPGIAIVSAPETGFATGRTISKYEKDDDIARELKTTIPPGAKPTRIKTRSGESVWGYVKPGEPTFYQITPNSLFESVTSTLGSFSAHPAETVGAALGEGATPGGIVKRALGATVGAIGGRIMDELGEGDTFQEAAPEAAQSGALAGGTSLAMAPVVKAVQMRKGILEGVPELDTIMESAKRVADKAGINAYQPTAADLPGVSPLWQRAISIYKQLNPKGAASKTQATSGSYLALNKAFEEAAATGDVPLAPDRLIDWDAIGASNRLENLKSVVSQYRASLLSEGRDKVANGVKLMDDLAAQADNYRQGVENYSGASKAFVTKLYDAAFDTAADAEAMGNPIKFNLAPLRDAVREIDGGIEIVTSDGTLGTFKISELDKSIGPLIAAMREVGADPSTYTVRAPVRAVPPAMGAGGTQTLDQTAGVQETVMSRPAVKQMDQIKAIRSTLGELAKPDINTGAYTPTSRAAGKLYSVLTDALENPEGGTPAMTALWKQANAAHKDRMSVLSALNAGKVLDDVKLLGMPKAFDSVRNEISSSASPATAVSLVRTLERSLAPGEYKQFQNDFIANLMRDPDKLMARSKKGAGFSPGEEALLPASAREDMLQLGRSLRSLNASDIARAAESSVNSAEAMRKIVLKTDPARLEQTLEAAGIPKQQYQAMFLGQVLSKVTKEEAGKAVVDPAAFTREMSRLSSPSESIRLSLLTPQQRLLLSDINKVTSFVQGADLTTSLVVGTILSKMASINPAKMASGWATYWKYNMLGKAASTSTGMKMIHGISSDATVAAKTRASATAAVMLLNELSNAAASTAQPRSESQ
jgi:hypothetical protein